MPSKLLSGTRFGAAKGFLFLRWIVKYWYLIILFLIILPSIVSSIKIAVETKNPTHPFFVLGTRLLTADNVLQEDVEILREDPAKLIGAEKPQNGIWKNFKYYWKFFFNVIWKMLGNVWLIFFPLVAIYRLVIKWRNISEIAKNWWIAIKYFLLYLFVVNTVILVHGLIKGNTFVAIPEGISTYQEYFVLFIQLLPFHGLYSLVQYLIQLSVGIA